MITHDMDLIAGYAERLIVMWNGRVILDGPTDEVFAQKEILERTFLKPPVAAEVAHYLHELGVPRQVITPESLISALKRGAS
jgi:energy-coupling factor transport system ATP-binding protein